MKFHPIEGEKWCRKCETVKPRSMFSPAIRSPDGVHAYCKACRSAYQGRANKLKATRTNAPPRADVWPRPMKERVLDSRSNDWRYPVAAANLRWVA